MASRAAFFERVRQSVAAGQRAGSVPSLPKRGSTGYQGAGADAVARFCEELRAAGGQGHLTATPADTWAKVLERIEACNARKILLSRGGLVHQLGLAERLRDHGYTVILPDQVTSSSWREPFFRADLGITNVAHLIAETGTVVMASGPQEPRSLSLLPPVHLALAERRQLLPDLFDLFDLFAPVGAPGKASLPACVSLITGPSKTGDIELKLVTGVHGPGELHVVLQDS